jgi:hypothetical protein
VRRGGGGRYTFFDREYDAARGGTFSSRQPYFGVSLEVCGMSDVDYGAGVKVGMSKVRAGAGYGTCASRRVCVVCTFHRRCGRRGWGTGRRWPGRESRPQGCESRKESSREAMAAVVRDGARVHAH